MAGRRFGKTFLAAVKIIREAEAAGRRKPGEALIWYVAPTYRQAKQVLWRPLKRMLDGYVVGKPNESEMSMETVWGCTVALRGSQDYDSLRGPGLDFLIFDEFADAAPEAWREVLRPMLADRQGGAMFIGTPRGFNHFYDLHCEAKALPDWAAFQYTTAQGGHVSADELEQSRRELDEKTYRQEYEASFENLTSGLVYYAFDRGKNTGAVEYDPKESLLWSLDFNVTPMCSVICQKQGKQLVVLEEISLTDSYTEEACQAFARRALKYRRERGEKFNVTVYGDPAGNARMRSGPGESDWRIVREFFARNGADFNAQFRIAAGAPLVRDRVNAVNAMLCNHAGERRLMIAPGCRELITDLERVSWREDAHGSTTGAIDKTDPKRTHMSDALGYLIERDFGLRIMGGPRSEYLGV